MNDTMEYAKMLKEAYDKQIDMLNKTIEELTRVNRLVLEENKNLHEIIRAHSSCMKCMSDDGIMQM